MITNISLSMFEYDSCDFVWSNVRSIQADETIFFDNRDDSVTTTNILFINFNTNWMCKRFILSENVIFECQFDILLDEINIFND